MLCWKRSGHSAPSPSRRLSVAGPGPRVQRTFYPPRSSDTGICAPYTSHLYTDCLGVISGRKEGFLIGQINWSRKTEEILEHSFHYHSLNTPPSPFFLCSSNIDPSRTIEGIQARPSALQSQAIRMPPSGEDEPRTQPTIWQDAKGPGREPTKVSGNHRGRTQPSAGKPELAQ